MSKIKQLDSDLIDQIAAGEVIDRPAAALKELVENSLDARSDKIEIQIKNGGHTLIQVCDNGFGMSEDDLRVAFKRHATSKIETVDDLEKIKTLGFRGEALPSIASVSKISARSSEDGKSAFEICMDGSNIKSFEPVSGLKGSTVKVKNIFYNTPARRKFLKKPEKEQVIINNIIRRYMLSRPDVKFKIVSNDKTIYDVPSQNMSQRIASIYGKQYKNGLLPVDLNKEPYYINGYTGNLSMIRKRQGEQYIFLNGRYIHNRVLNSAVFSAYQSLIQLRRLGRAI